MANRGRANYRGNRLHDPDGSKGPLLMKISCQAGATQAIEPGTILESTGNGNTQWVPLDSDFDMSAAFGSGGKVVVAWEEVRSGDLAGYYWAAVPRPGDLWEFDLDAANNLAVGTALYFHANSTATNTVVTNTAGTNIIGHVAGQEHYPQKQGHASRGDPVDRGTTIGNQSRVIMCFQHTNSYWSEFDRE